LRVVGVWETLSESTRADCAVVMPSLDVALHWWPIIVQAFRDRHGTEWVVVTKTAVVSRKTRRVLRLLVPYSRDPTQPLDWRRLRRGYVPLNLYNMYRGGIEW